MDVAIIKNGYVVNIVVCESIELAQQLYSDAICIEADDTIAIGSQYPAPDEPSVPELTENDRLNAVEQGLLDLMDMLSEAL